MVLNDLCQAGVELEHQEQAGEVEGGGDSSGYISCSEDDNYEEYEEYDDITNLTGNISPIIQNGMVAYPTEYPMNELIMNTNGNHLHP